MKKNIDYFNVNSKHVDPIFSGCVYKKDTKGSWGLYLDKKSYLNVWGNSLNDGSITLEMVKRTSIN